MTRFRGFTLSAFQQTAVNALQQGQDVLVSAPTGAGKTLVAEYAIERCIESGQRAIYTAPIKALSNQKYRDFRLIEQFETGIMTGDVTIRPDADVLIMTTEIFRNAIFDQGPELSDVGIVVFDEIHYMDDLERGTVWEESIIFAPEHIRILALSATVSNLKQFCDWMGAARGHPITRVESKDRPVPLSHFLYFPDHGPRRADKVKEFPRSQKPRPRGGRAGGGRPGRGQGRGRPQRGSGRSRANELLDRLTRENKLPALFFCFSRKECEIRARENARRRLLEPGQRDQIEALLDEVCDQFEVQEDATLEELRALAAAGIGYHHAGLLPLHKELVERLFTSGLLRLLFTTETFALGINMPARSVVFSSQRKFDGISFDRLRARDYQQMAGRAGRQGIDEEGLVYSVIDDDRIKYDDVQKTIFGSVEPIRSRFSLSYATLLNLHRDLGDRIFEAWEKSFNNYQWSRMSRKKRERNEKRQREAIEHRMALLQELDYLDAEGLKPKGEVARCISGYELAVVELVSSGLFRAMNDEQIALVLCAAVTEHRKSDLFQRMNPGLLGHLRKDAEHVIDGVAAREKELGIHPPTRHLNFRAGAVVHAWWEGWSFEEIRTITNASHGDLVRTFRLVSQLLRQMALAWSGDKDLRDTFHRVRERLNRDEVDARRQLELGDPTFRGSAEDD